MEEPVMVSDLIDHGTTQWDEDVLRAIFLEEDVEEILKIPLRQGMEDSVAWSLDKKGVFLLNQLIGLVLIFERDGTKTTLVHHRQLLECHRTGTKSGH
jgi:hypothetical protein